MTTRPPVRPHDSAIDRRLDALLDDARAVEAELAAGQEPATDALETGIQQVCAEIGALERKTGQAYLARLHDLTDALERIGGAMRGRLDGLSAELKQHGARQSAVRAYGRAGTPGGTPDDRA